MFKLQNKKKLKILIFLKSVYLQEMFIMFMTWIRVWIHSPDPPKN